MAHALVTVNQIDAMGVQGTRGRQAVIYIFLADLSSEARVACAVERRGINGFAVAAI